MKLPLKALCLAPALFLFTQCEKRDGSPGPTTAIATADELAFAKSTFHSLAKGELSVAQRLDWNTLTVVGENIGAKYTAIASEVEKEKYRTAFINNYATSFRESGGNIEALTNWRVVASDHMKTEVAADSPGGVLTITVMEKDGANQVVSIQVVK